LPWNGHHHHKPYCRNSSTGNQNSYLWNGNKYTRTNWNGPWDSGLKIHAAGFLTGGNGFLNNRGSIGIYWNNLQYDASNGWSLYFSNVLSTLGISDKANGFTLRCIKE
jgi:hypothetical protein